MVELWTLDCILQTCEFLPGTFNMNTHRHSSHLSVMSMFILPTAGAMSSFWVVRKKPLGMHISSASPVQAALRVLPKVLHSPCGILHRLSELPCRFRKLCLGYLSLGVQSQVCAVGYITKQARVLQPRTELSATPLQSNNLRF